MKYSYHLNGKEITEGEFLRELQGFTRWIMASVEDAIADEKPIPMFKTEKGPLVITAK